MTLRDRLSSIVVVGPGAEAAAVAVALGVSLQGSGVRTTLVSPSQGQSGTGVARVRGGDSAFHRQLGIDEHDLMKATASVYSLGSRFNGFASSHESVFVPLGAHGTTIRLVPFHHYWLRSVETGSSIEYNEFSLTAAAAARGRFEPPTTGGGVMATVAYDLLIDLDLYTLYLLKKARQLGIEVLNGEVSSANLDPDGRIDQLRLVDGSPLCGDFFIDCSAKRTVIGALGMACDFEDWSDKLPCDRLVSVLSKKQREPMLYTLFKAHNYGWLLRGTLRNFTVESFVYCSENIDDSGARQILQGQMSHSPVSSFEQRTFRSGRYLTQWRRNCVAMGPAAIAVEPLCVSSLQLAQNAALRLLGMLPAGGDDGVLAAEFNRITSNEHSGVRDFTILHYHLAERQSTPFWVKSRKAALPCSLQERIELFRNTGRVNAGENEWFGVNDWLSCFINFGMLPEKHSPLVEMAEAQQVTATMLEIQNSVRQFA